MQRTQHPTERGNPKNAVVFAPDDSAKLGLEMVYPQLLVILQSHVPAAEVEFSESPVFEETHFIPVQKTIQPAQPLPVRGGIASDAVKLTRS